MVRCWFLLFSLLLVSTELVAVDSQDQTNTQSRSIEGTEGAFIEGTKAYKAGDYKTAVIWFDRAISKGNTQPTLRYNRAVALYKLKQYTASTRAFTELLSTAEWADIARYNLGLIALAESDQNRARTWFELVKKEAKNPRLQQLAGVQLSQLNTAPNANPPAVNDASYSKTAAAKKSTVFFSLGAAVDDNASGLADDLVGASKNASDAYLSGLAYGQIYVDGTKSEGVKIYGLTQIRRYQTFTHFDSQVTGIGTHWETTLNQTTPNKTPNKWNLEIGGRILQTHIDGERLATQISLLTKAGNQFSKSRYELSHQSSYFNAGENYQHIEGWQHQFKAMANYKIGALQLSPTLYWESNTRDNKATTNNFYSYSPRILGIALATNWDLNQQVRVYGVIDRSKADYDGRNLLTDIDGRKKQQTRASTRQQITLGARYRLAPRWFAKAEYSHLDNNDNFVLYSQSKNLLSITVDYAW